jgi:hypothetical protein
MNQNEIQNAIFDSRQENYVAAKTEFLACYRTVSHFRDERNFHSARCNNEPKFRAAFTAEGTELVANFWAAKPAYHAAKRAYREVDDSEFLGLPICQKFNRYVR